MIYWIHLVILLSNFIFDPFLIVVADDPEGLDEIGLTTSQLLRLRKFEAEDHSVPIEAGVKLNLVRIINPELPDGPSRRPVLFIHGIFSSANYFIVNSINARPHDWTYYIQSKKYAQISRFLANDPSSKSLPLLLSNLGHDVWLLNRRPTRASQKSSGLSLFDSANFDDFSNKISQSITGLTSFMDTNLLGSSNILSYNKLIQSTLEMYMRYILSSNKGGKEGGSKNYWDFSLDEQATIDLPKVIDYILSKNQKYDRLSIVSHSTGSALVLMMLSDKPEYETKIHRSALFAAAMDLGQTDDNNQLIKSVTDLEPIIRNIPGPVDPLAFGSLTKVAFKAFCTTGQLSSEQCKSTTDAFDGLGSEQLDERKGFSLASADVSGSLEIAQLIQSITKGRMNHFDDSRVYDVSRISNNYLSLWQGNTDALVTTDDTDELVSRFRFPIQVFFIDLPGIKFDHSAFLIHKDVESIINIPVVNYLNNP